MKFLSGNQHINYSISCYNTDIFSVIEEELYQKFPKLKLYDVIFLCAGNTVNSSLTLEENKIKDNNTIMIVYDDEYDF